MYFLQHCFHKKGRLISCCDWWIRIFFTVHLSVPLVVEYEDAAHRILPRTNVTSDDLDSVLDYLCAVSNRQRIYYLWRPFLRDPKDDMLLELAVVGKCDYFVTFNGKDFAGIEMFGMEAVTPKEFLQRIGVLP